MSDTEQTRTERLDTRGGRLLSRARRWIVGSVGLPVISLCYAVGTVVAGAAAGVLPTIAVKRPADLLHPWLVTYVAVAVSAYLVGAALWWWRSRLRRTRGIAYIVREVAYDWNREDKERFLSDVQDRFAAVRFLPAVRTFDGAAHWPHGSDASRWETDVDDMVRQFEMVDHDRDGRDRQLPRSLFMWAPFPVAAAFGRRVTSADRGRRLLVRQRDSNGRQGDLQVAQVDAAGYSFRDAVPIVGGGPGHEARVLEHRVTLRTSRNGPVTGTVPTTVLVLVLRTNHQSFSPLPAIPVDLPERPDQTEPAAQAARTPGGDGAPLTIEVHDAAGLGLSETVSATLREWRYLPRPGETYHHWRDFPQLVAAAVQWVAEQAAAAPDATILLGALLPQEASIGLGIRSVRQPDWPSKLWPLHFDRKNNAYTIPRLNLGR